MSRTAPLGLAFLLGLGACGSPVESQSYLAITSISPSGGAANVSLDTDVVVSFSEPLVSGTVGTSTLTLADPEGNAVATEVSYSEDYWAVSLSPTESLATATTYTLTVSEQVEGQKSGSLARPVTLSFTTIGEVASADGLPVANAGPDQTVPVGVEVVLNGEGSSDPQDDPLSYQWAFDAVPDGSAAELADETSANPRFTPDVAGAWIVSLVVSDGTTSSDADFVQITAE